MVSAELISYKLAMLALKSACQVFAFCNIVEGHCQVSRFMFFSTGQDRAPGLEGVATVAGVEGLGAGHAADPTAAARAGVEVAAGAAAETERIAADLDRSHARGAQPDQRVQRKMTFSRMETEPCHSLSVPVATLSVVC